VSELTLARGCSPPSKHGLDRGSFHISITPVLGPCSALPPSTVNQTFARKYLAGSAIGVTLPITFNPKGVDSPEIIGVVDDVRQQSATDPPLPAVFAIY
jgi:hypothetical protein